MATMPYLLPQELKPTDSKVGDNRATRSGCGAVYFRPGNAGKELAIKQMKKKPPTTNEQQPDITSVKNDDYDPSKEEIDHAANLKQAKTYSSTLRQEYEVKRFITGKGVPYFAKLLRLFQDKDHLYFVFQKEIESLHAYWWRRGRFEEPLACHILLQVVRAIRWFHQENLLYRDLKSENVLICNDGTDSTVVLCDFGATVVIPEAGCTSLAGTYGTWAPEQTKYDDKGRPLIKNGVSNMKTELFQFGVLLYEMLTGKMWSMTHFKSLEGLQNTINQLNVCEGAKALLSSLMNSNPNFCVRHDLIKSFKDSWAKKQANDFCAEHNLPLW